MSANPKDPIYNKIKDIPSLDEKLDIAVETLNFRINNNMSASYKNSAWNIVKEIADSILATGKTILKYIYRPLEHFIKNRIVPRTWHNSREVARKEKDNPQVSNDRIIYVNSTEPMPHGTNQVYMLQLLRENGSMIWTKIGETFQYSTTRFKQILRQMWRYGVRKIVVKRIWKTGDIKPRRVERKFHSFYEDKNPSAWVPNDRTTDRIDENEADDKFVEFMMGF